MLHDTPYDILSAVLQYLPDCDVEKLRVVGGRLREVGLDAMFRDVKFNQHNKAMKVLCELLSRDDVAHRVQTLTITPWPVQPRTKTHASRSENIWNHINTFFNPNYMEQEARKRVQKRIDKDIKRVKGAIDHLHDVWEYHILYDERSSGYHRQLFEAFLSPTLEHFSPKLKRLTIKVPFELLPNLSYVRLPELLDLDISLCTGEARMNEVKYALDGFFVFIHNLRRLQHLGITATSASRYLDLSYFSKRWGTFPHLKSFSLSIPFDGALLSSPEDLYKHVLEPHSKTLERLKLSTSSCGVPTTALPRDCHLWIQRILRSSFNTTFPRLREVELALRPLKACLDDLHQFLALRAPTLEKLFLTDRVLANCELEDLFGALCRPSVFPGNQNYMLKHLKIKVPSLNARLLALIARRFPGLKTLGLAFRDISPDNYEVKSVFEPYNSYQMQIVEFAHQLRAHSSTTFAHWDLHTLNLVEGPPSFPWIKKLEPIIIDCFSPSLNIGELPPSPN